MDEAPFFEAEKMAIKLFRETLELRHPEIYAHLPRNVPDDYEVVSRDLTAVGFVSGVKCFQAPPNEPDSKDFVASEFHILNKGFPVGGMLIHVWDNGIIDWIEGYLFDDEWSSYNEMEYTIE
ncbi:hypothetical protein [Pseudosulfitobacter sp. SM2401]|uniref:hypothetical protein n=1 Tax=Pseudosulfitobacter sp. SM2401 TaxID=3350098 RepID=UPI0036F43311